MRSRSVSGFTLIELIVFVVVISISLVALLGVFNQSSSTNVDPIIQTRALECAQAKLDEVLARRFDENTVVGGIPACGSAEPGAIACAGIVADAGLDDVGDYHGHTDTTLDNCSISVTVVQAGADLGLSASQARRITVVADSSGGGQTTLSAYRVNF